MFIQPVVFTNCERDYLFLMNVNWNILTSKQQYFKQDKYKNHYKLQKCARLWPEVETINVESGNEISDAQCT
jgi:hypothetical protein